MNSTVPQAAAPRSGARVRHRGADRRRDRAAQQRRAAAAAREPTAPGRHDAGASPAEL